MDSRLARRPPTADVGPAPEVGRAALSRRGFLLSACSCLATGCALDAKVRLQDEDVATLAGLDAFMEISRVLTGMPDLSETLGRRHRRALLDGRVPAQQLAVLWRTGGFDGPDPPTSVGDLAARGVYDTPALAELCDTVAALWYSGVYVTASGEPRVVTYTGALAWRALGDRPAGPSACAGAFGHWADAPAGV